MTEHEKAEKLKEKATEYGLQHASLVCPSCGNVHWHMATDAYVAGFRAAEAGMMLGMGDDFGDSPVEVVKCLKSKLKAALEENASLRTQRKEGENEHSS